MSVVETEGIEISVAVPNPTPAANANDEDVGLARTPFNDLEIVGGLPTSLNVIGISDIVVYNVQKDDQPDDHSLKYVVGIETVYRLDRGKFSPPVLHGTKTQYLTRIRVTTQERIITTFVGVDSAEPNKKIRALRFTKTNVKTGEVTTKGYVGTLPDGHTFTYSVAFGDVVAFQGIKSRGIQGRLVSLGVQTRLGGLPE